MKDSLRGLKIFWYVIWSGAFIFAAFVSAMVLLGFAGTDGNQWLVGLFGVIVFWYACSTYRRKAMELMDEQVKDIQKERDDDDEHSDNSF